MSILVNLLVFGAIAVATLYVCANFARRQWVGLLVGAGLLLLPDVLYFHPRHGGYLSFIIGGSMAGSDTGSTEGTLGSVRSALSIYYGDTNGRYPEQLADLWKNKKYLPGPPRPAHVFAMESPDRYVIIRPHWYKDASKIKNFSSTEDSDDTGGWGYVNDPKSRFYGNVFVNCTHFHIKRRQAWNLLGHEQPAPPAPVPSDVPAPVAVRGVESLPPVLEGFSGRVLSKGQYVVVGAELVFTPENGGAPHSTTSDNLGRYRLDLPAGRYRVSVTHAAHRPYSSEQGFFVVRPGQRSYGNVNLQPL